MKSKELAQVATESILEALKSSGRECEVLSVMGSEEFDQQSVWIGILSPDGVSIRTYKIQITEEK